MASPVADSYGCASGGVIAAGRNRFPPGFPSAARVWTQVGTNTLSALDPAQDPTINPNYPSTAPWRGVTGQESVVTAWSGAVWDEANKRLVINGGGHADYAGNEVYQWSAQTGAFSRLSKPSGAIGNTGTLNDGNDQTNPSYFDGRPRSAHTYNHLVLRDGVMWSFQGSTYVSGFGVCSGYRFENNDWIRDSTSLQFSGNYGGTIWDATRGRFLIIGHGNGRPMWYDPIAKTTGLMNHWTNNDAQEMKPVHDTRRDLVLQFSKFITAFKLDDTSDAVTITTTGTPPDWATLSIVANPSRTGAVYDYDNDRYLVWHGGSSIFVLTPPAIGQNPLTATWTWSKIDAVSGTPSSPTPNGTYGRFWYSPSLGCIGVVNSVTEQMWIFRLT